jgi:hypothetical protein
LALSIACSSFAFFAGTLGLTTSTKGVAPTTEMGVMSLTASKGIFLNTLGFTTWLFDTTPIVCPSAGARTITDAPVMPPAPGRFSMTTPWPPSALVSEGAAARMMVSTPEPAPTGRTTRSGLSEA